MTINKLNLDKKNKYLLACSFGPDSMALFNMLYEQKYNFIVAHVNYHLRNESDDEERQLKKYCADRNIQLYIFNSEEKIFKNIEAKCRDIRYSFFERIYHQEKCDSLLVAHNEDDNIETYLLQKKRKNLVKAFGISENTIIKGMTVLRPLLQHSKMSLQDYCDKNHVPYAIDKTNLIPMYERNKIRLNVVSRMDVAERTKIIEEINKENVMLQKTFKKLSVVNDFLSEIQKLSDVEFAYYLNLKIDSISPDKHTTYKQSIEIRKMLQSDKPNVLVNLFKNRIAVGKEYDRFFVKPILSKPDFSFVVEDACLVDNDYLFADLKNDGKNRNIKTTDYPLTIRSYQTGDRYFIKGYIVEVRRLFIDWKMPLSLRKRWPIVTNHEGKIIYIPRYQKDFKPDNNSKFYVKECFTLK